MRGAQFLHLVAVVAGTVWHEPLLSGARLSHDNLTQLAKAAETNAHRVFLQKRAARLVSPAGSSGCPDCEKDYSEPCPNRWRSLEAGDSCAAPWNYEGLCSTHMSVLGRSATEKREIEAACSVCWPCKDSQSDVSASCSRDLAQPCPNGYSPVEIPWDAFADATSSCVANIAYEGPCELEVSFTGDKDKETFAARCETSWPCTETCEDNARAPLCPTEWQHIGDGMCVAPLHYRKHGCPLVMNFRGWPSGMKANFAKQCAVRWACGNLDDNETAPVGQDGVCDSVDLSTCPRGWFKEGVWCKPPADYGGSCAVTMNFKSLSDDEKLYWAAKCVDVAWPCRGEAQASSRFTGPSGSVGHHRNGPIE